MINFDGKLDSAKQDQHLYKLSYADETNFDSHKRQNKPYCLLDTRVDILRRIMKWSADLYEKTKF